MASQPRLATDVALVDTIAQGIKAAFKNSVQPPKFRTGTVVNIDPTRFVARVKIDGDTDITEALMTSDSFPSARVMIAYSPGGGVFVVGQLGGAAWTPYTPSWTASITNPALGTGSSIIGFFSRQGPNCSVHIRLQVGSVISGGSGTWSFGLPFPSVSPYEEEFSFAKLYTAFDNRSYFGWGLVPASGTTVTPYFPESAFISSTMPGRNRDASNVLGTGIPLIGPAAPGGTHDPLENGNNLILKGTYQVA